MVSRSCLTRTVISTVLPLPFAPTRPTIGLLDSAKSDGSAVWHSGQARKFVLPPHFGHLAGPVTPSGGGKAGYVSNPDLVSSSRALSTSFVHSAEPRPRHWYHRRETSIRWKQNGQTAFEATMSP